MYEINCYGNCGQIMLSTSPEWSVPKWTRPDEFTCSKCADIISGDAERDER
jgi:hypothetical protein